MVKTHIVAPFFRRTSPDGTPPLPVTRSLKK
jgi:hypothetical protein